MKIFRSKAARKCGSALVIVLVLGALMLTSVGAYLTVVNHQNYMSVRSQSWNTSISVVEAGIEDAMEHLNSNPPSLATQGWGYDGSRYVLDYDMGDGMGYSVSINMAPADGPEVISRAFMKLDGSPITPMFSALGLTDEQQTLSRAVRVKASRSNSLIKGMVAKQTIDMNGNNVWTDSYDSGDATKSLNGRYDPNRAGNVGDVAVNSSIVNGINLGNANIYGHVSTGPRGTIAVGPLGGVGEKGWVALNAGLIQPGWYADDMNFTFPEPVLPYTSAVQPTPRTIVNCEAVVTALPYSGTPTAGDPNVLTNVTYTSTPTYPGKIDGLTTNLVWKLSYTPPSPTEVFGQVTTNVVKTLTDKWPGALPGEITTNTYWHTETVYPGSGFKVITNYIQQTAATLPNPIPSGTITTNWVYSMTKDPPLAGTYIGTPTKEKGWYIFKLITGYTWTVKSYTWATYDYYYTQTRYTYQTLVYGVPQYTYSWNKFATNTVCTTNYYDYVLDSGKYIISTLSGKVYVTGNAELVVMQQIRMSGNDAIEIAKDGSLHAWIGGTSSQLGGNGVINRSGNAANCILEFTPSVTSLSIAGNGEFSGVILAPYAAIALNGGGSAINDFCGAVIGNTIKLNGHYKFHYDEALGRLGSRSRYLVRSWDEIDPKTAFTIVTNTTPAL